MSNYDKLISVLEEVFQLNQADLDFGIYRILNQKREEISEFLRNRLVPQVKEIISQANVGDHATLQEELSKLIYTLRQVGVDPESSTKVQELRGKIGQTPAAESLENEIFSQLTSFFKRYYKDGDFISIRRYKKDVYAIPYEGEEVKLYWANHDQYYIKTSEYLKNYAFKLADGRLVCFELAEASTEKDNRKEESSKERRFRIFEEKPVEANGNKLTVFFTYEPTDKKAKQDDLNKEAAALIKKYLPADWVTDVLQKMPAEKDKDRTLLYKHIQDFTARNTFDYFIHKDLAGFLSRELDFYIKNEVLHLDDINTNNTADFQKQLIKVRALKEVGGKIITFLAQLENFQKRLWLKKKFVVDTQYCITLDRIPEAFYPEIIANDNQRAEWVRLFAIDEMEADLVQPGYSVPLTIDFLKSQSFLVLDTAFFSEEFKLRLIATIENLDSQLDGLLINSENYQALNLLKERNQGQIKCVYIDPPYNTSASEILYKNDYKHSSWLSLLNDRIRICKPLMNYKSGILCATIDDVEQKIFSLLLEDHFGEIAGTVSIRIKPSGRPIPNGFALAHEYAIFARLFPENSIKRLVHSDDQKARYKEIDENGRFFWEMFRKAGSNSRRIDRPTMYYPFVLNISTQSLRLPQLQWEENSQIFLVDEELIDDEKLIYPIKDDGSEGCWYFGYERAKTIEKEFRIEITSNQPPKIYYRRRPNEGVQPTTHWSDSKYSATEHGTALLKAIFGIQEIFSYPKSIYAVEDCLRVAGLSEDQQGITLDFFAGSGTTAHAVINLNREDGGHRKYILVEMGHYFDTVTKPRIQKVIYSKDWKDGKPVSRKGSSHAFKYLSQESYEDTLNNLQLKQKTGLQQFLELSDGFQEEYMLSYMLDVESEGSLLNVAAFENPFDYQLRIIKDNEAVPTRIDLVETFNYLIGLKVKTSERIRGFHVVTGENLSGEQILVIWRNLQEKNNADLDAFFQKQQYNTRDREFDRIYVNGDNNLENLKIRDEQWKVVLIEEEFLRRMFEAKDE